MKRLRGISIYMTLLLFGNLLPVYSKTYTVAKNGSDNAVGTTSSPWLTINHAAQNLMPGDTVIVKEGIYHETVVPARGGSSETNRITYLAAPGEKVVISASEKVSGWVQHNGNTWKVTLPKTFFKTYNPFAEVSQKGFSGTDFFPEHNGFVIFNDLGYSEKFDIQGVTSNSNTFYVTVDSQTTTLYANFGGANPNTGDAQISVRKQCFAPNTWGLGYITLDGFTIRNAANPFSDWPSPPERAQWGMVSVYGGLKWIIQNCTIQNARTIGLDIGLGCDVWAGNKGTEVKTDYSKVDMYGSHVVRKNKFLHNGQSGIVGVFSWNSDIIDNVFIGTNSRGGYNGNAETASLKVHYNNDGLIKGNYFYKNNCLNLWTDWGNQGLRITQNLFVGQGWIPEAIHGPIVFDNNILIGSQIIPHSVKGIIFSHNLVVEGRFDFNGTGINTLYWTPHTMSNPQTAFANTSYFKFHNNLFSATTLPSFAGTNNSVSNNYSNSISGWSYKATDSTFSCNFTLDNAPFEFNPYITSQYIGPIPPSNQSLDTAIDSDFLGKSINSNSPIAGPLAEAKKGPNTFQLWPKPSETTPLYPKLVTKKLYSQEKYVYTRNNKIFINSNLQQYRLQGKKTK